MQLTVLDHDRDVAGMTYVYPVVSRRSGGVSVGINLNPNDACNWRCIYCQVPGLTFGKGPPLDLSQLERELRAMLAGIFEGDFLERYVPDPDLRQLRDIAFSGNGEPTSSPQFRASIDVVAKVMDAFDLVGSVDVVLITNGSLAQKPDVLEGIRRLAELGGRVWFKLDAATREGAERINSTPVDPERHLARLRGVAEACPTWVQTCVFALDGEAPPESEQRAYVDAIAGLVHDRVSLRGVLLYGLARESHQPEAPRLSRLPEAWMEAFAERVRACGIDVRVYP